MTVTSIEWTDRTWNPVRGCTRVSEGCRNCYAERMASRGFAWSKGFATSTPAGPRWTGKVALIPELLDVPLRWRKPQRIFVNSMSDLFHSALSFEHIAAVYGVMAAASHHTFQVLTKRPQRRIDFHAWLAERVAASRAVFSEDPDGWIARHLVTNRARHFGAPASVQASGDLWPLPNVWEGTSVEDQATADERIPLLLQTPAAVRFISYEPALGPVDFRRWTLAEHGRRGIGAAPGLGWVIVGGESGPGARPFDVAWARSTVAQCKAAGVPVFVKQMGRWIKGDHESFGLHSWLLDDGRGFIPPIIGERAFARPENAVAFTLGGKGGNMAEWPEDIRVREMPA